METVVCYLDLYFICQLELLSSFVLLPSSKFYKAKVTQLNLLSLLGNLSRITSPFGRLRIGVLTAIQVQLIFDNLLNAVI